MTPSQPWKVPVGPSGGSVASWPLARYVVFAAGFGDTYGPLTR